MRPISKSSLTLSYALALGVIATLSILSHWTLASVMDANGESATIINLSGRQRMLSQRIASLASQEAAGDATARAELARATDEFDANHRYLSAKVEGAPASPRLRELYFDGTQGLASQVRDYVAHARHLAQWRDDDPRASAELALLLAAAREPLIDKLNEVTVEQVHLSDLEVRRMQRLETGMLAVVLITLLVEAVGVFRPMVKRISDQAAQLMALSQHDTLTGLLNRRGFFKRAEIEIKRSRRNHKHNWVMAIDIDHFKKINDAHGHAGGDRVLEWIGQALLKAFRAEDVIGRFGGEEFVILLEAPDQAQAVALAERLRTQIEGKEIALADAVVRLTVSIGVAGAEAGTAALQTLIDRADAALYEAKGSGRNRVVAAAETSSHDALAEVGPT